MRRDCDQRRDLQLDKHGLVYSEGQKESR